jgi:hypothetical protein
VRPLLFLLALALCAGCRTIPDPGGSRYVDDLVEVRADEGGVAFVTSVAALSRSYLERIGAQLGVEEPESLAIVVCRTYEAFKAIKERYRFRGGAKHVEGFYSERSVVACLRWENDERGAECLAHELVHHVLKEALPDLPLFWSEGISYELTHSLRNPDALMGAIFAMVTEDERLEPEEFDAVMARSEAQSEFLARRPEVLERCSLKYGVGLGVAEVERRLRRYLDPETTLDRHGYELAAALVRFGIETEGWSNLQELAGWSPDAKRFVAWLAEVPRPGFHARLPAIR